MEIPLGYMVEATWSKQARWLGVVGRTELTAREIAAVNLSAWSELQKPFTLLEEMFDQGWGGPWGRAGLKAQAVWPMSSILVDTIEDNELCRDMTINTKDEWAKTRAALCEKLDRLGEKLPVQESAPHVQ